MTLESFSASSHESGDSHDSSQQGYPELDLSNPDAFFDELSGGLDSLISNDATPIYLYERLSGLFERLPEDFRTQNNITTLQDFLLRVNFIYNPENVIQGEFDGVNVDIGLQQMDNDKFQALLANFNYYVENYDLSECIVSCMENKLMITPINLDESVEYVQSVFVTPDSLFQINDNFLFVRNTWANQIIDELDLSRHTDFESAFETLYSLKHLYGDLYDKISNEISSQIFYRDVIDLKTRVRHCRTYNLSCLGSGLIVRSNLVEYDSNGLKIRSRDLRSGLVHAYIYNAQNQLDHVDTTRGSDYIQTTYYETRGENNVAVRREDATRTDIRLGYDFRESVTGYSRYIVLSNGLKVASFQYMQSENSDLTKADYYQFLADNINTDNYQYFYDHLFRYTRDEIEWTSKDGLIISEREYWQSPDETLFRVDNGSMQGDCDDIAFLMHHLGTLNPNVYQTFVIGITEHAINVTSRIEDGEYVLTRFGTFGSQEFRGATFIQAINQLLSTYDREGEGRGTPVVDRVNSQITLLTRRGSYFMSVKVPLEMLSYIRNSDDLQLIINALGFYDTDTEISMITLETCVYHNYFFDLPKLEIPNYLESIKNTTDTLNDAFLESTMIEAFMQFEEFVQASGSDLSFENDRMNFVKLLLDEHSSNDAENVLEALSERYPGVRVYSQAYSFLTLESGEEIENNVFVDLENFKETPTLENLSNLIPNESLNATFLLQVEAVIYRSFNLELYTYYLTFFPSRLSLKDLAPFNGSIPDNLKDLVYDKVNNFLLGLNQDSRWDLIYAFQVVCKFMPDRFSDCLEILIRQVSHISLPLIVARLDLVFLESELSKYSDRVNINVFRDFQCLVYIMTKNFTQLEATLSTSFFQNVGLFKYCLRIISENESLWDKILFFIDYFSSNSNPRMFSVFRDFCELNPFNNQTLNRQLRDIIASLESR